MARICIPCYRPRVTLFNHRRVATQETADGLIISAQNEYGWLLPALMALVISFFVWNILHGAKVQKLTDLWPCVLPAVVMFVAVVAIIRAVKGSVDSLSVTAHQFTATRCANRSYSHTIHIPVSEVRWVGYKFFGRGTYDRTIHESHPGLFATLCQGHACLLPNLTKKQATEAAAAVNRRFPHIATGKPTPPPPFPSGTQKIAR